MADMMVDMKKERAKFELRNVSDKVFNHIKQHISVFDEESIDENVDMPVLWNPSDVRQFVQLDEEEAVIEKFSILSIDNRNLRNKVAILRYQLDLVKEKLDERTHEFKSLSAVCISQKQKLAYLRHVTTDQTAIIERLQAVLNEKLWVCEDEATLKNSPVIMDQPETKQVSAPTTPVCPTPQDDPKSPQLSWIQKLIGRAKEEYLMIT